MLEKPDIPDTVLITSLRDDYRLDVMQVDFLPIGADVNTAVYRAVTDTGTSYFVKLRSGVFDDMTVVVPKHFHDLGIKPIITPLSTQSQQLWADLGDYQLTIYPYIDGHNGYEVELSDQHWIDFGHALKAIHTVDLPQSIVNNIQHETYSDEWREKGIAFLQHAQGSFSDPVANELALFLRSKKTVIRELVSRAEQLADILVAQSIPLIVCHADIHAGNILIDTNGFLYIVDWDTLIVAPKERDLMYAGGGQFGNKRSPQEEETLFYQGYGQTQVDPIALAYYRYERIIEDIVAYCEQILLTEAGGEDRGKGLRQLMNQFQPHNVIDIAFNTDHISRDDDNLYI